MCGICGNQGNKNYYDRRIMYGSFGDRNSRYGWNINYKKPKSKGGIDKNQILDQHTLNVMKREKITNYSSQNN